MRSRVGPCLRWCQAAACGAVLLGMVSTSLAETREHHPWARFHVGSWKQVRLFKETMGADGAVTDTSTTETRTTLMEVAEQFVKLRVDVTVEVAGRRFSAEPRYVQLGWAGEGVGQKVSIKQLGSAEYKLDGQEIACLSREVTVEDRGKVRVSQELVRDGQLPRVLKREVVAKDASGQQLYETLVYVTATDMPHKVLAEIKPCWHVKTVLDQGKSTTITHEVHAADVPGGVVSQSNKVLNSESRLIERSTLELIDYGLSPQPVAPTMGRRRLFHRKHSRRK